MSHPAPGDYTAALAETCAYLDSPDAREAVALDPYWPKWDGPWWRMLLLMEIGRAELIPASLLGLTVETIERHYLRFFPRSEAELPPGADIHRETLCHCMVGSLLQLLRATDHDPEKTLPWLRPWLLKYALPGGGWNCDNGNEHAASFVSTCAAAEGLLASTERALTTEEDAALAKAADWLLERKLFRSKRTGAVVAEEWLRPMLPRFYEYDIQRGLRFLANWSERTGKPLPAEQISEAVARLDTHHAGGPPLPERALLKVRTLRHRQGRWHRDAHAGSFPLLDAAGAKETGGLLLAAEWAALRPRLVKRANLGC